MWVPRVRVAASLAGAGRRKRGCQRWHWGISKVDPNKLLEYRPEEKVWTKQLVRKKKHGLDFSAEPPDSIHGVGVCGLLIVTAAASLLFLLFILSIPYNICYQSLVISHGVGEPLNLFFRLCPILNKYFPALLTLLNLYSLFFSYMLLIYVQPSQKEPCKI